MSPIVAHVRLAGLLMAPLLLLARNAAFETKKIDYKTASKSQVPTLEIPPDLTSPTRDDRYAVTDTGGGNGSATSSAYDAERSPATRTLQITPRRAPTAGAPAGDGR